MHVQLVAAGFTRLLPQEGADRRPHVERIRLQRVRVVVEGLVLQAPPHGQIRHDVDAELGETGRGADAGPQQDGRAAVRAPGEDHLDRGDLGAAGRDDTDRTPLVEQDAIHEHVA